MSEPRKPIAMNDNRSDQQHWRTPEELRAIESQLSSLRPREDRLDRERLLFLAGQASVQRPNSRWAWPASLATMTALAATLLVMLLSQPVATPPELPPAERSLAEIRQDFALRRPPRPRVQGITTATVFREEELAELLNERNTLVTISDANPSNFREEQLQRTILTPSSWDQLFDESTPLN